MDGYMWIPLTSWISAVAIGIIVLYVYFYVLHIENREHKEFVVTMTEKQKKEHDLALGHNSVRIWLTRRAAFLQEHRKLITKRQKELLSIMI